MTKAIRQQMIDTQLLPAGVVDDGLLQAFLAIGREDFINDDKDKKRAYNDKPITSAEGRCFLPPVAAGLLLQAADVKKGDKLLVIGGGTGYEANILTHNNCHVVALASPRDPIKKMVLHPNFMVVTATDSQAITQGYEARAPYRAIFVLGLLAAVPHRLLAQLADGGYLLTILRDSNVNRPNMGMDEKALQKPLLGNLVRIHKNGRVEYFGQVAGMLPMPEFIQETSFQFVA